MPNRVIVFGPFWPFGHWQCEYCGKELVLKLFGYYIIAVIGLSVVSVIAVMLRHLGFEPGGLSNAIAMFIVAVYMLYWLPARLAEIKVLNA